MPFDQAGKTKVLLWCDRHCCVCKKACGVNIEVNHIVPEADGGPSDLDNAIPVCMDCHSNIGYYNNSHPKGNKYKVEELKTRREQVYEEFTRHLVPPIHYTITNILGPKKKRKFPDVGFELSHFGDSLPVKIKSVVDVFTDKGKAIQLSGHYGGETLWNLNPRFSCSGHFDLPEAVRKQDRIRLRVSVTIVDQYDREHSHLPLHWIYVRNGDY